MSTEAYREMNVNREMLKAAWEEFHTTGLVSNGAIREEILQSWQRARDSGVDPYADTLSCHFDEDEKKAILEENRLLVETARPFLESLVNLIKGMEMVVYLTSKDGFILNALGEGYIWEHVKAGNAVVGGSFDEKFCGPTAPSMAALLDTPYQMVCEEHYMTGIHMASCAAAPIHDEFNNVIGSIDITTSYEMALKHPHTLGMMVASAQVIEKQLRLTKELRKSFIAGQYLRAAMAAMTTGLIILDKNNKFTHINQAAEQILGLASGLVSGNDIQDVISNESVLHALMNNVQLSDYELMLDESAPHCRFLVSLIPIVGPDGSKMGSLLTLKEFKELQKLMKQVVGLDAPYTFANIWGKSPEIMETIELATTVSGTDINVIITGESGTGKEMIAQSIHNMGPFAKGPFLAVNCAAIPNDLIESELFGYEAGTFTGALKSGKPGRFELADGGTLFLDEVNGMSLDMQAKLLRVLEEKRFSRLGGKHYIPLEARIIAASNKILEEEVAKGNFRGDLYYRLNVVEIRIPPLRDRIGDVALIVQKLIPEINRRLRRKVEGILPETLDYLERQPWPGNVRQLKNWVERAVTLTRNSILTLDDFPHEGSPKTTRTETKTTEFFAEEKSKIPIRLGDVEKDFIKTVVDECNGNISMASLRLGISRATIYRKMNKYALILKKTAASVSS